MPRRHLGRNNISFIPPKLLSNMQRMRKLWVIWLKTHSSPTDTHLSWIVITSDSCNIIKLKSCRANCFPTPAHWPGWCSMIISCTVWISTYWATWLVFNTWNCPIIVWHLLVQSSQNCRRLMNCKNHTSFKSIFMRIFPAFLTSIRSKPSAAICLKTCSIWQLCKLHNIEFLSKL